MRKVKRIGIIAAALLVLLYAGDDLSLRLRIPRRGTFGSVEVHRYYAIALKNRKTEYMPLEPESRTCVHALFPHYADPPCWYLERHRQQFIQINPGPKNPFEF